MEALLQLLTGRRIVALVGAGCSTESGIPDYRGEKTARKARNPVQYKEFISSPKARQRYWARSMIGWPKIDGALPNQGHAALAALEEAELLSGVITQNVDGLHQRAGSRKVIELHGALDQVSCLDCKAVSSRTKMQNRLQSLNPSWGEAQVELAPDGDAELLDVEGFQVAPCEVCEGALKPGVVFFGETVPRARVEAAYALFEQAEVLLVLGSSLTVFSGFRFVRRAVERGVPVGILNLGASRGDALATVTLQGRIGELMPEVSRRLIAQSAKRSSAKDEMDVSARDTHRHLASGGGPGS